MSDSLKHFFRSSGEQRQASSFPPQDPFSWILDTIVPSDIRNINAPKTIVDIIKISMVKFTLILNLY